MCSVCVVYILVEMYRCKCWQTKGTIDDLVVCVFSAAWPVSSLSTSRIFRKRVYSSESNFFIASMDILFLLMGLIILYTLVIAYCVWQFEHAYSFDKGEL